MVGIVLVMRIPIIPSEIQFSSMFVNFLPLLFGGIRSLAVVKEDSQRQESTDVKRPHGGSVILNMLVTQ